MKPNAPPLPLRDSERGGLRGWAWPLALLLATFLVYSPALRAGYVWDDDDYVTNNRWVKSPDGLPAIWSLSYDASQRQFKCRTPQYYPLVFTSFWLEHRLWGLSPLGFHAVNVALHALNALLLWRLLSRLGVPGCGWIAAVFALHPVAVESVAWITERKNLLSTFFMFSAFLALWPVFRDGKRLNYFVGLLLFIAALLSKTVACSLPAVLLLARWIVAKRVTRRDVLLTTPLFVVGLLFALLTAHLEKTHVQASGVEWQLAVWRRALLLAPSAFCFYAGKIAWPYPLIFNYPRWDLSTITATQCAPLLLSSGALAACAIFYRRGGRAALGWLLLSAMTLTPALGFFPIYPQRYSWVADHFQYVGMIGFIGLLVHAARLAWLRIHRQDERRNTPAPNNHDVVNNIGVGWIVGAFALLILGGLTFWQTLEYRDADTLWRATLRKNPDSWIASYNLGFAALQQGKNAEALPFFEHAARFSQARYDALTNWGHALVQMGRPDDAVEKLNQAVALQPDRSEAFQSLGLAYVGMRRWPDAQAAFESATRLTPESIAGWRNLANVYVQRGDWPGAANAASKLTELAPDDLNARLLLANAFATLRRHKDALEQYQQAERWAPQDASARLGAITALHDLGRSREALERVVASRRDFPNVGEFLQLEAWILATATDAQVRDGPRARQSAEALVKAVGENALALDALAAAQAECGDFEVATRTAEQALQAARKSYPPDALRELEARAALYRAGKAFRVGQTKTEP